MSNLGFGRTGRALTRRTQTRWLARLLCSLLAAWAASSMGQESAGISEADLTALASRAMSEFDVPGMAIGIVKDGKVQVSKGFGVREIDKPEPVDTATLFKIASNSKAFTTAALAVLVDEGAVSWDGLVIDHMPEFRMYDPWVTAGFMVTDLLTHRSGLSPFKGDMLLWPEPNAFTAADIIHALRYFEPVSGFRSKYAYDNLLYIVAGELVARISGTSWGEFVENRLMRPAGMKRCFADRIPDREMHNLATPHGVIEERLSVIDRGRIPQQPPISAAAGGIVCSLDDMLSWVSVQLNHGTTADGKQLFSVTQSGEMWKPRTLLGVSERDYLLHRTHFRAYGLGWRLADVHGFEEVSHTGTLAGMKSYVVMIPELDLGVVLLTNGSSSAARAAVMGTIVRSFMPVEQLDLVQYFLDEMAREKVVEAEQQERSATLEKTESTATVPSANCCTADLSRFAGVYRDPWFGDVVISLDNDELVFLAEKSPKLSGVLSHHDGSRFVVRWTDRSLGGDAFVQFDLDRDDRVTGITMTKLDDGDFDFEDLELRRVE